jgi:hypothetical protein
MMWKTEPGILLLLLLFFGAFLVGPAHSAEPLELAAEFNPDPIEPSELSDAQISVTNATGSPTGELSPRVLRPEHINITPVITDGG